MTKRPFMILHYSLVDEPSLALRDLNAISKANLFDLRANPCKCVHIEIYTLYET